jgi:hypothetical protein
MTLPAINLDDRSWDYLVEEAKRRISAKCPGWTDFNPSDPGMMLVELMAWMTETVLYRLNRIPEQNYIKFLELIDVQLRPATPAKSWVFFQAQKGLSEKDIKLIPLHTRVSTRPLADQDPITFVTCDNLQLTTCKVIMTCSRYRPSMRADVEADAVGSDATRASVIGEYEKTLDLFGDNPWEAEIFPCPNAESPRGKAVPHNLYFGFFGDPALAKLATQPTIQVLVDLENPMEGKLFLEWEAWDGDNWQPVGDVTDTTMDFRREGSVLFENLPALKKCDLAKLQQLAASSAEKDRDSLSLFTWLAQQTSQPPEAQNWGDLFWLRARLIGSEVGELPRIRKVQRRTDLKGCAVRPEKAFVYIPAAQKLPEMLPAMPPVPPQPLETSTDFYPLGIKAVPGSAFYLGSELFAKRGATIAIEWHFGEALKPQSADGLEIHWEYNSRDEGWQTLGKSNPSGATTSEYQFQDETHAFTRNSGTVSFQCPSDIAPSEVGGQLGWFMRVRVDRAEFANDAEARLGARSVLLGFTNEVRPWERCVCENYSTFELHPADDSFNPFYINKNQDPAFYLCFDRHPHPSNEPYQLFLDVVPQKVDLEDEGVIPPRGAQIEWEYKTSDEAADGWKPLEIVQDGTKWFSQEGILKFLSPKDWAKSIEFHRQSGYWLRVRWKIAEYLHPPRLRRVLPNGVEVVQAVQEESVLGSSNGLSDQSFRVRAAMFEAPEILVRESNNGSHEEAARLRKEAKSEVEKADDGCWVRWKKVINFLNSNEHDRHFTVDLGEGTFEFGDGRHGFIPPQGENNVKARYRTTQGSKGNVGSGTITVLEASLPQVQGVTNVHPASGGSDWEDIAQAKQRGPWEMRHRDRAVTRDDFIELAKKASPLVAKAECFSEEHGMIRIVIIPRDEDRKPKPSQRLIREVWEYLKVRSLINTRLAVEGPIYELIDVEVDVVLKSLFSGPFSEVERQIRDALHRFVHPLTGMADGSGWSMGRTLHRSELYYRLEILEPIDYVDRLAIRKSGQELGEKIEISPRSYPCFSKDMKINRALP